MKEVILNDECVHCKDKECHDGEHFCNQAFKENSFYKNAKLYKGLEVIQRPTYADLEKENAELKETVMKMNDVITKTFGNLTKAKELLEQWFQTSKVSSCDNINIVTDTEQFLSEVEK